VTCGWRCTHLDRLREHSRAHLDEWQLFTCLEDGSSFTCQGSVRRRSAIRSGVQSRPHVCPECGRCFARLEQIQRHLLVHEHRRNAAAYDHESPTLCDSVNSGANLLPGSPVQSVLMPWQLTEAGLRSYGSSTARPYIYPCPECGRPFTRKQHVRRHLEVHKRKRRTTASDSVRADRQLSDSVRSKVVPPRCRFVRFATKPRLHPCPECGKSFTRKQHVRRHLQVHETQADGTAFDSVDASENTQSCDSVRSDVNLLPCDLADSGTRSLLHDSTSCEVMSLPYDSADLLILERDRCFMIQPVVR